MKSSGAQNISEVEKIWYYVMSILYRAGNRAVRIPSSYELAKEFKLARSTVRIALEKLTREGYLITRRGTGTYTNPKQSVCSETPRKPLIGLMLLSGNLFFYPTDLQNELECFFGEFKKTNWNFRLLTQRMDSPEEVRTILANSYLDGLITFGSPSFIPATATEILPTVHMVYPEDGVTTVYPSYRNMLPKLLELTGRDKDILIWSAAAENAKENFIFRDWTHPGLQIHCNREAPSFHATESEQLLAEEFSDRCPDWFVLHPTLLNPIRKAVIARYGEARARRSLWLFTGEPAGDRNWPCYFLQADRHAEIRKALEYLKRKLSGDPGPYPSFCVDAHLIREYDHNNP
ncbi:MAG: GntR family transcriptional regulator [Victivallaceae bacterium]|nr:GntR family transcriptional regulator [Victivallaceae bacterium]